MLTATALAIAFAIAGLTGTSAQQQPDNNSTEQLMEQKYKNIQVLKGLPAAQLRPMMNLISASLGVGCAACHVRNGNQWEFDKDDKREKQTARRMIQMTMDINKNSFGGNRSVTCFTCHQGHEHPNSIPSLPVAPPPPPTAAAAEAKPPEAAVTPQQILEKYTQAVGGKEAAGKLKALVFKGTLTDGRGQSVPLEIQVAGPDKILSAVTLQQGTAVQALSGTAGWTKNPREQRALDSVELGRLRSLASSLDPLQLREPYPRLNFGGKDKIGDKEAVVLRGMTADRKRIRYWFDAQTGLLLRRVILADAVIGLEPEQTDYEDYREVDGVKIPFTIRTLSTDGGVTATRKFTEVKHNVTVDEAQFNPPAKP
ncbi:MAG TPA: c-type cytochrome [Blastocatellia bacterium]|nr:c-type cytochrome [Blastocatellia bacterium]